MSKLRTIFEPEDLARRLHQTAFKHAFPSAYTVFPAVAHILDLRQPLSSTRDAHTLQAAAGGVGVPLLHWFETIDGKDVMTIDTYGPTLEKVFCQSGRYFSMQSLLLLADQLLARVEFIHSRNIIHGNLNPQSFAFGVPEWQTQQVLLVDFGTEIAPHSTVRDDLQAVGLILSYFYSGAESWEQYQQQRDQETTAPVLTSFLTAVASHKPVDYGILREIFHDAYHDLVLHLEIALDIKVLEQ
ncbi:uncharacterized protein NFIA_069760 [Aspergillus fischeri NRRL 181]|uniref:Protein kinase domain-containing protein n=1 Tax=Neosartorya fischeri (strain ATCC 1020 / DSM 3700 / CBS 544.65 / FGSC A1164 / JCM 1740 / NRRL 181 / WB 181) TaxID=331117 RepID=A1D7W1_NEOFI|nr:uncharacterized protein NFIA_069760 [Aspergillus fischeri NRRL 181]EAW21805.1 hypothetical protein NFIA_069760 [Aspergillus fischeri NRRL 181]